MTRARSATDLPLVVDLDGSLVATDTLFECLLAVVRTRPFALWALPFWLLGGRASVKQRLAALALPDPAALPYRQDVLDYLDEARAAGRSIVLASATDHRIAEAVADHLGRFDRVLGTAGGDNLKGARKRAALVSEYGARGYEYLGDSRADFAVWQAAGAASCVGFGDPERARIAALAPIARVFAKERVSPVTWLEELRVSQWVKNVLVFVPIVMSHRLGEPALWAKGALAFACLSLVASAVYLLNDLIDLPSDRAHPTKRERAFARGALPVWAGLVVAPLLASVALLLGFALLPASFGGVLCVYLGLNVLYTFALKRLTLIDVVLLAGLYTLRVVAGTEATGVDYSGWLLAFALFFFLNLAFLKRYADLRIIAASGGRVSPGRSYSTDDAPLLLRLGPAAALMAMGVLGMYVQSEKVVALYAHPLLLWLLIPILIAWTARAWQIAHRGGMPDDPVRFTLYDPVSWGAAAVCGVVLVLASLR